jgi:uncharacterized protein YjbJ (UPF0337 family)
MSSSSSTTTQRSAENPSKVTGIKDQAVGAIKETVGNVLHKEKLEVEGRVQKEHGKTEYELAKGGSNQTESHHHHQQGHDDPQTIKQQSFPEPVQPEPLAPTAVHPGQQPPPPANNNLYPTAGLPYPAGGSPAPPAPTHQGPNPQAPGQHDPHFDQQAPPPYFGQPTPGAPTNNEPSKMSGMKDQAVGSMKENVGHATNKPEMEMAGKEQKMHGKNEEEIAKMNKEHEKVNEGEKVSKMGALKDKTMGSMKEKVGEVTGNQDLELKGKAQNLHGKNEAEFAKAQKEGKKEPENFTQGHPANPNTINA